MPEGMFLVEPGANSENLDAAEALAKERGEHLWIVMASYQLTAAEVVEAYDTPLVLGADRLLYVAPIGCFVCEQVWEQAKGTACPGEPRS